MTCCQQPGAKLQLFAHLLLLTTIPFRQLLCYQFHLLLSFYSLVLLGCFLHVLKQFATCFYGFFFAIILRLEFCYRLNLMFELSMVLEKVSEKDLSPVINISYSLFSLISFVKLVLLVFGFSIYRDAYFGFVLAPRKVS